MPSTTVDCGFASKCEQWRLLSHFFPSKIGGKPAWLSLDNIPEPNDLRCPKCCQPTTFLLQVYSPAEYLEESAYHRTLFVFICKSGKCKSEGFASEIIIYRSQIPRRNSFYNFYPYEEVDPKMHSKDIPNAEMYTKLCWVCGCKGPSNCSRCKVATYCSKDHQVLHWRNGHKRVCGGEQNISNTGENKMDDIFFSEYLLEVDTAADEKEDDSDDSDVENIDLENCSTYVRDLHLMASSGKDDDPQFKIFQKAIASDKDQVLRHGCGKEALWISSTGSLNCDIPPCDQCGAPRIFEFQIMPQLLYFLHQSESINAASAIDWGTLAVYSCARSCSISKYVREICWRQAM